MELRPGLSRYPRRSEIFIDRDCRAWLRYSHGYRLIRTIVNTAANSPHGWTPPPLRLRDLLFSNRGVPPDCERCCKFCNPISRVPSGAVPPLTSWRCSVFALVGARRGPKVDRWQGAVGSHQRYPHLTAFCLNASRVISADGRALSPVCRDP